MVNQISIPATGAYIVVVLVFYLFISVSAVLTVIIVFLPVFKYQ